MTDKRNNSWVRQLNLSNRHPSEFFLKLEDIDAAESIPPQAHAMRRAWQDMKLDGILCLDNAPLIYFKEVATIEPKDIRVLHGKLWNQGIAPILLVISPTEVYVYSGLTLPARKNESVNDDNRLVETFDRVAQALELRQFTRKVELGEFFRTKPLSFNPELRVDRYLLKNLGAARAQLENAPSGDLDPQIVQALLGRTIFSCYLVDRKVINSAYFSRIGAEGTQNVRDLFRNRPSRESKKLLYRLFKQLQKDFNGDIFDGDLQAESEDVTDEHINILASFLNGDNLGQQQLTLGFWAYDFKVVPIETISGIYELFLEAEGSTGRRDVGAYYTPRFLAEIVLDVALEGCTSLLDKRYLDTSCGSGIFLVGIFNQLAEEWSRENKKRSNDERADALFKILKESIFGVDKNPTACRIAAFSLYLALLDQLSPRDIWRLQERGKRLPNLVASPNDQLGRKTGTNIFPSDFFDENLHLPDGDFDIILGNPAWSRPVREETSSAEDWCKQHEYPFPQRQTAAGFVWKALHHITDDGQICFLLPASLLFGYAKGLKFQQRWMSECTIEKIINFADMRWFLFEGAAHPCIVVKYRKGAPSKDAYISYLRPKTEIETLHARILVVSPEDRIEVKVRDVLNYLEVGKAPLIWKQSFWGSSRDRKFLGRLGEYPTLEDREDKEQDYWVIHEGYNRGGRGKPINRPILHILPFLPSNGVAPYVIRESVLKPHAPVTAPNVMGSESIFLAPHVLFPHGASESGKRIKAGYSSFDCSFNHAIRGIRASRNQENELRMLACVLASPLALYYFFHTSANWAIERPDLLVTEYKSFPFPNSETDIQQKALREAAVLHRQLEKAIEKTPDEANIITERYRSQLDSLVYEYYDVDSWEESLIVDTVNLWITSANPHPNRNTPPALERSDPSERVEYVNLLLEALNTWTAQSDQRIDGNIVFSENEGLGIVSLTRVDKEVKKARTQEISSSEQLEKILERVNKFLPDETKSIRLLRNLKVFDGDKLYLMKPVSRRYWTKTSALNDADDIAAAILTAGQREKSHGHN
jgi:hypothetical protein